MPRASFRFYAGLNDFLPSARRQRDCDVDCAENATLKHQIEALGVPHTEVELILVDGVPADFTQPLQGGVRVAVYPRFTALYTTSLPRLRELPPAPLRFIADAHLGGLARLLRMAGFDTLYRNDYPDDEVVAIATHDGRVVLTRDRELLKRRDVVHGAYLRTLRPVEQFREIVDRCGLAGAFRPFGLCMVCNAPLRKIDKREVADRLPPSVRALHERFTTCERCGRVYWEGIPLAADAGGAGGSASAGRHRAGAVGLKSDPQKSCPCGSDFSPTEA